MDEYWKALIKGLTPDKEKQIHLWWKAPIITLVVFIIIAMVL